MGKISKGFNAELKPKLSYQITAVLCYDYCQYAVFDSKKSLQAFGSFPAHDKSSILKGFEKSGLLELKISKFLLASNLAPLNFIPPKSFNAKKIKSYFKNVYPIGKLVTQELGYDKLKNQNMIIAYGLDKNLVKTFRKQIPKLELSHISEAVCNYAKKSKYDGTIVLVGEGYVSISCHKKGGSYFYNKFDCFGDSDILYYLSLVFEVLELDPKKQKLLVGGEIIQKDNLHILLKASFKNIKWVSGFDRYCRKAPGKGAQYAAHFFIKQP